MTLLQTPLSHLRQSLRAQRQQLSREIITNASIAIAEKILSLPEFQCAQHIAFYAAQENEVDLSIIFNQTLNHHKWLYLPVFSKQNKLRLSFYHIDRETQYIKNKWGIDEPVIHNEPLIQPEKLDIIFLPLVAFDVNCHRIGRGAGCYDRCLQFTRHTQKNKRPTLIGLAYEFQKVKQIIPQSFDVSMDYVVTNARVYSR